MALWVDMCQNWHHTTNMNTRRRVKAVAEGITSAIAKAGISAHVIAKAADVPNSEFDARIANGDLTISELVNVGGFLHVEPKTFLEDAA